MCSRYEIDVPWEDIVTHFGFDGPPDECASGEIRPTNRALVVESNEKYRSAHWGIPAPWDGKPLINARSETLLHKQTFKPLLGNRCVVPASAYFEWRKDGKKRLKNRIFLKDEPIMGFAGLMSDNYFTIITCKSSASIAHIHDRMPVILPESSEEHWCDNTRPFIEVSHLLKPVDPGILLATEATQQQPDLFA
ncbi:MAG: SOS response-associated peptidase [Rhodospirillales bacterium]|nr:SOS response-associated peptidase [Rhodospirillales bacterium]